MGHTRLGNLPKSRKWQEIVAFLADNNISDKNSLIDEIELIVLKTLNAAETGLEKAVDDIGLRYTFYLLTQLALSSREENWQEQLSKHNIDISNTSSTFDLISEIQIAIDDYVSEKGRATDISDIAQQAFGEAVGFLVE